MTRQRKPTNRELARDEGSSSSGTGQARAGTGGERVVPPAEPAPAPAERPRLGVALSAAGMPAGPTPHRPSSRPLSLSLCLPVRLRAAAAITDSFPTEMYGDGVTHALAATTTTTTTTNTNH